MALAQGLCFVSEPWAAFPCTCNPAFCPHTMSLLGFTKTATYLMDYRNQVIFQLTHGHTVKIIIKYNSCLRLFRKPLLSSLTVFQREPGSYLSKYFVFLSSSSHVYLNCYWFVDYTCLQKGNRAAGQGSEKYMLDYKYCSFSVFLLGQSKYGDYSRWAGGPVEKSLSGWPGSSKRKEIQFLC